MSKWNKYIEQFNEGLDDEFKLKRRKSKFKDIKKTDLSDSKKRNILSK